MKVLLWFLAALLLPIAAQAQTNAVCPAYSQHFRVVTVTANNYTVLPTDQCHLLVMNDASANTLTLPVPNANFLRGFMFFFFNKGAGTTTITAATGTTINGGSTLSKATGVGADVFCDGANWYAKP